MNVMASDKDHEVNCKACRSQIERKAKEEK